MLLDNQITSLDQQEHLMIDFQPLNTQCMISNWDQGIHFYIKENDKWQLEELDPGFVLISDEYATQKTGATYHFMSQIPNKLQKAIKHFTQNQFSLLRLLSLYPSLRDIFEHSPNLVWMVVIEASNLKWDFDDIIQLLQQKREKIISEIIQSNSSSTVSFINKVQLFQGDKYEYRLIKECSKNSDIVRLFFHWKVIPTHALVLLRKYPSLLKTGLLPNLIDIELTLYRQQSIFYPTSIFLEDIGRMANLLNIKLTKHYYKNLKTVSNVIKAHDRLVDKVNNSKVVLNTNTTFFPICPLGDTDNIIQIKNRFELGLEGRNMHHCISSYDHILTEGNSYIYKIITSERGTLHIIKRNNTYDIEQFKLACNKKPSDESFLYVRQWLAKI